MPPIQPCKNNSVDILLAPSGSSLIGKQELCWMDPEMADECGVEAGDQVRVRRNNGNYALYTVEQLYQDGSDDNDMRMAADARAKLGTTSSMTKCDLFSPEDSVLRGVSEQDLQNDDEFGEFLDESSASHTDVAVCAPHGGSIETRTDEQSERCHDRLVNTHSKGSSNWRCKGFKSGGGAFDRWHITSTDIGRKAFQYLDQIGDRGFSYAVSFHGYTDTGEVIKIGGSASDSVKNALKDALDAALSGEGVTVTVLGENEPLNGDDPENFVNWLTANGDTGIQLEQSLDARVNHWETIADTVADYLATLV